MAPALGLVFCGYIMLCPQKTSRPLYVHHGGIEGSWDVFLEGQRAGMSGQCLRLRLLKSFQAKPKSLFQRQFGWGCGWQGRGV